jgi:ATP-dependent Clp protease ATP-binding subunit ClpC
MKDKLLSEAKRTFRPELLNRFDDMVVFRKLERDDLVKVAEIEVAKLCRRLEKSHIRLSLGKKALEFLVDKSMDSALGARPIRRAVQRYIEDPLSEIVLAGKAKPKMVAKVAKDGNSLKF